MIQWAMIRINKMNNIILLRMLARNFVIIILEATRLSSSQRSNWNWMRLLTANRLFKQTAHSLVSYIYNYILVNNVVYVMLMALSNECRPMRYAVSAMRSGPVCLPMCMRVGNDNLWLLIALSLYQQSMYWRLLFVILFWWLIFFSTPVPYWNKAQKISLAVWFSLRILFPISAMISLLLTVNIEARTQGSPKSFPPESPYLLKYKSHQQQQRKSNHSQQMQMANRNLADW